MSHWEESEIFKLAIENASDHIIITDPDGHILYANKAVEQVTGYSNKEIIGKRPSLWGGLMPPAFYRAFWKRIKTAKKPFTGEIKNRRKDGDIYDAEIKVAPVLNKRGEIKCFVGIERDITKLKQIEKAKNEIIALTAHQLKNAPSTIKILSDSLLDGIVGKLSKKQAYYIGEIRRANKNNIDLISSLLNVTRLELGTFSDRAEILDIKITCEKVIKSFETLIRERELRVSVSYDRHLRLALLNEESFQILLHNLLSNAVKYTPDKGEVHLTISIVKQSIKGAMKEFLHIEVEDTGCGIPKQDQARVFTKMFRADNVKSKMPDGSGLGLYMVKLIVKKLGGRISFKSEENKGTTFYLSFPLKRPKKK